jgi:steroid delta-isomerase-like uncharacterized protein
LDLSEASIRTAKSFEHDGLRFACHDMRRRFGTGAFDYVFNLFTSFGYFETAAEHRDDIIAPDYVRHDPGDPFPARGPEDVKRIVTMLRSMLPDFSITVEAMIAEGDLVVSRYTATATDTRGYMGMPPTGRAIRTPAIQIFRFADGKIVESWAARDDLGTLQQLGHVPLFAPSRTAPAPASRK